MAEDGNYIYYEYVQGGDLINSNYAQGQAHQYQCAYTQNQNSYQTIPSIQEQNAKQQQFCYSQSSNGSSQYTEDYFSQGAIEAGSDSSVNNYLSQYSESYTNRESNESYFYNQEQEQNANFNNLINQQSQNNQLNNNGMLEQHQHFQKSPNNQDSRDPDKPYTENELDRIFEEVIREDIPILEEQQSSGWHSSSPSQNFVSQEQSSNIPPCHALSQENESQDGSLESNVSGISQQIQENSSINDSTQTEQRKANNNENVYPNLKKEINKLINQNKEYQYQRAFHLWHMNQKSNNPNITTSQLFTTRKAMVAIFHGKYNIETIFIGNSFRYLKHCYDLQNENKNTKNYKTFNEHRGNRVNLQEAVQNNSKFRLYVNKHIQILNGIGVQYQQILSLIINNQSYDLSLREAAQDILREIYLTL